MKKYCLGFSIIEVMIVVAIIGILSAVGYANFSQGSEQSRDAQRQGDLRIVSTALDLYKSKYGRYPEGCNGPNTWSGHAPSLDCRLVDFHARPAAQRGRLLARLDRDGLIAIIEQLLCGICKCDDASTFGAANGHPVRVSVVTGITLLAPRIHVYGRVKCAASQASTSVMR
jgi:prepilin-type N-terminal cleavage/methylation domain-containing protein